MNARVLKFNVLYADYAGCDTCNRDAKTTSHPAADWLYVVVVFGNIGVMRLDFLPRYKIYKREGERISRNINKVKKLSFFPRNGSSVFHLIIWTIIHY